MPVERVREKTCSACGAAFPCGPGSGREGKGCWCEDLPALTPDAGIDCLCPACLTTAIGRQRTPERN